MGLRRYRAVGHRAGREACDDHRHRFDLIDRDRWAVAAELEQPAQRPARPVERFDLVGVLAEQLVATLPGGVLQQEHRLGIEQVQLALAAPQVLPTHVQAAVGARRRHERVGVGMAGCGLRGQDVQADPTQPRRGAAEVLVDERLPEAERLEHLRPGVGRDGGDAHLRHHLEHALGRRLDVVRDRLLGSQAGDRPGGDEVLDRLEGEVGVDRGCAVADEQRDVVHLTGLTGLDHQTDLGALPGANQVLVHGRGQQQGGDGRMVRVAVAVGQDQDPGAVRDGVGALAAHPLECAGQCFAAAVDPIPAVDEAALESRHVAVGVDVPDLGQLVVVDHRPRDDDLPAGCGAGGQQVQLRADRPGQRGHHLLADRVQRRVGDLGKQLAEVVEQQARTLRKDGEGCVGAHRTERLDA